MLSLFSESVMQALFYVICSKLISNIPLKNPSNMLSWRRLHLFFKPITVGLFILPSHQEAKQIADYLPWRINIRNY